MEKNYEERFQHLLEGYRHEVGLYRAIQKNYDERIEHIDKQIAKLQAKRDKIKEERENHKRPHYLEYLLPQVMELLNEAVAERGYQFDSEDFRSFGLSCETHVFQDYKRSQRNTTVYFCFRPSGDNGFCLKVKSGEYKCDTSIAALNDLSAKVEEVTSFQMLIDHIEECERREPPKQLTEDEVIEMIQNDKNFFFEYTPQSLWTYRTVTEMMKAVIKGKRSHFNSYERIPAEMVDKEMFLLGLEAQVFFYHFLPKEKLEELGAFEEDFLAEQISRRAVGFDDVPIEKMTTAVLKKIVPGAGFWYVGEWAKKCSHLIDQETAVLMMCESVYTIQHIPEEFRTYEMCQSVFRCKDKGLRAYIPAKFLTETGRLKRKA